MNIMNNIMKIKISMLLGEITYDEARIKAEPLIKLVNEEAQKIAKKFGKTHRDFTFTQLMR